MPKEIEHKLLDELLSNINQVLFVRDACTENHDIIYVNNAYERIWGRTRQSLKDNPASYIEAVHPDDRQMVIDLYMKFLQGNIEYEKDFRIIRTDGEVRWMFAKTFAIRNEMGEVYRIGGIVEDITDRKENELSISRLNEVQDGIIKMLAHDLRTPIAGIKLTASLLDAKNEKSVKSCTEQIMDTCDSTLLMMDDLLSHIQINSDGAYINRSKFIIEDQINLICEEFRARMMQKGIHLDLPKTSTLVYLDGSKFRHILSNLLTNAIKFNNVDGRIIISINAENNTVRMSVSDTGIGIADNLQDEAFMIFTKARRDGTSGEKSTGIGLSITKRLVELHDGKIVMNSKVGKGTEMIVTFPN